MNTKASLIIGRKGAVVGDINNIDTVYIEGSNTHILYNSYTHSMY